MCLTWSYIIGMRTVQHPQSILASPKKEVAAARLKRFVTQTMCHKPPAHGKPLL
jgi:hypothetical protein